MSCLNMFFSRNMLLKMYVQHKVSKYPKNKYHSCKSISNPNYNQYFHECRISSSKETKTQEALIKGTVIEMGSQESIAHNKSLFFQSDLHIIAA